MKKRLILFITPLLLVGCKSAYKADASALLENPLYLELYSEQMVDTMVGLEIYEDPIVQDAEKKKIIDETKEYWFALAKQARKDQRMGSKGGLVPMKQFADGEILYKDGVVHFGPTFATSPGPDLHAYLTTAIDPRDVLFPDESAVDLGIIDVPYGAQSMIVPQKLENPNSYRTLVIWDNKLDRLYGFAQLTPMN